MHCSSHAAHKKGGNELVPAFLPSSPLFNGLPFSYMFNFKTVERMMCGLWDDYGDSGSHDGGWMAM